MASLTDAEFEAAKRRGDAMLEMEPRAAFANYSRETRRVTVELVNGCAYVFPAALVRI